MAERYFGYHTRKLADRLKTLLPTKK